MSLAGTQYSEKTPHRYSESYQRWREAAMKRDKAGANEHGRAQLAEAERARAEAMAVTYEAFFPSPSRSRRRLVEVEDES